MTESALAEIELLQTTVDHMDMAMEVLREHRDMLEYENIALKEQVTMLRSQVERLQVAMSQGAEL
jgi:hypothetical protein